ncbi:MAG: hypothetical protein CVU92_09890 [Firmicutes bacterium HGW-Firmicutes-17]|jgi:predicted phosphodiesterase|nr:MAG: hypothetical protein CVU92_09890 [Firmicutes bacterium HGW-Firmicutes-17]
MLSFIHLSDIHFRNHSGDSYDLDKDIRIEILRDINEHAKDELVEVAGILVCGDIAFSGKEEEYKNAINFLDDICSMLNIQNERVYCVPGNHDLDQSIPQNSVSIMGLQDSLSNSLTQDKFDQLLANYCRNDTDGLLLFEPIKMYNKNFAGIFNCDISREKPFWNDAVPLSEKYTLFLNGMNSTTISNHKDHTFDSEEERQMFLPTVQIPSRQQSNKAIFMTLCHHPPECWFDPENRLKNKLDSRVHLQLYGHKHIQTIKKEKNSIIINSGATHPERSLSEWIPRYNWLTIDVINESNSDYLSIKIYPRILEPTTTDHFIVDTEICIDSQFVEYKLKICEEERIVPVQNENMLFEEVTNPVQKLRIEELNGMTYKTFIYSFMSLPIVKRSALLAQFSLITDEDDGKEHYEIAELVIERAKNSGCIVQIWDEIEKWRK